MINWKFWKRKPKVTVIEAGNPNTKSGTDYDKIEEILQQLRDSQGPGDTFVEITPKGTRITKGKDES